MPNPFEGLSSAEALAGAERAQQAIRAAAERDPWNVPYVEDDRSTYGHRHPVFGDGSSPEKPTRGRVYRWCDEHPVALWLALASVIVLVGVLVALWPEVAGRG